MVLVDARDWPTTDGKSFKKLGNAVQMVNHLCALGIPYDVLVSRIYGLGDMAMLLLS